MSNIFSSVYIRSQLFFVCRYIFELVTCIHIQIFLSLICTVSLSVPNIFCPLVSGKLFSPCKRIVQLKIFFFTYIRLLKNFWGDKQLRRSRVRQKMDQMRVQSMSLFSILTVAFNKNTNSKKEDREPTWILCFIFLSTQKFEETCWFYGETVFFQLKNLTMDLTLVFFWYLTCF